MWKKSKALLHFQEFKRDIHAYLEIKIDELHLSENFINFFQSDNGEEYIRKMF